jgi:hypothetical protein
LPEKQLGLHFIPQPGCRYLSASVVLGAAAEATGIEQWFVEWILDDQREKTIPSARHASCRNGERLHFLATAQTNQLALEGARVLDPACFREAIGDPKNARQAGMTSAASIFFLI